MPLYVRSNLEALDTSTRLAENVGAEAVANVRASEAEGTSTLVVNTNIRNLVNNSDGSVDRMSTGIRVNGSSTRLIASTNVASAEDARLLEERHLRIIAELIYRAPELWLDPDISYDPPLMTDISDRIADWPVTPELVADIHARLENLSGTLLADRGARLGTSGTAAVAVARSVATGELLTLLENNAATLTTVATASVAVASEDEDAEAVELLP